MLWDRSRRLLRAVFVRLLLLVVVVNVTALVVVRLPAVERPPVDKEHLPTQATALLGAAWRAEHDTVIDLLLPAGVGGMVVVPRLDDNNDGEADAVHARIYLAADAVRDSVTMGGARRSEKVAIHERGHLLGAAYPELMDRLLDVLPQPAPDAYAATDGGEHFAEMFANAWELLGLQGMYGICIDFRSAVAYRERQVPGTAGVLAWFIPIWEQAHDSLADSSLKQLADSLSTSYRTAIQPIAAAVASRRMPNGHLRAWPRLPGNSMIRRVRASIIHGPAWKRPLGWALWPAARL